MKFELIVIGMSLIAAGCGSGSGTTYSCTYTSAGKCFDYGQISQEIAQSLCIAGTLAQAACATANRVGSCKRGDITTRYYSSNFTNTSAQTDCAGGESPGEYTPGRARTGR